MNTKNTPLTIDIKGKSQQIAINKNIPSVCNSSVLLLRCPKQNFYWMAKVTSHSYSNYIRITSDLKERPQAIEIIKTVKIGQKPKTKYILENQVDMTSFIDKNWACVETDNGFVSLYKAPKGPSLTIKRIITIDSDLSWSIGFFLAEGTKCDYGIGATNQDFRLLEKFQQSVEKHFGIRKSEWIAHIRSLDGISGSLKARINQNFGITRITYSNAKLAAADTLEIKINSTTLSQIFSNFISKSLEIIANNQELSLAFLRGYETGDGCVHARKGFLYGISIVTKSKANKDLLSNLIEKLYQTRPKVRKTKGSYEILCTGINLMTNFILDEHFSPSKKQKQMVEAYLQKQYTKSHIRYWKVLRKQKLTGKEIEKATNRSFWSVLNAMNKDSKQGLIKIERKNHPKSGVHRIYSLTNKGDRLLNLIER